MIFTFWLSFIALFLAAVTGWIMNIVTLFHMPWVANGEFILRLAGVPVAIVGAIVGWM